MIEYLKRIYYFAKRIAKIVADIDPIDSQIELQPSPMVNGTGSIK